jgi:hypothetical protein
LSVVLPLAAVADERALEPDTCFMDDARKLLFMPQLRSCPAFMRICSPDLIHSERCLYPGTAAAAGLRFGMNSLKRSLLQSNMNPLNLSRFRIASPSLHLATLFAAAKRRVFEMRADN